MNDQTNNTTTATATENTLTQEELRKKYEINNYSDFLHKPWACDGAIPARVENRLFETLEQIHGNTAETLDADYFEPLSWFIIHRPEFALNHTDEPIFYDSELDIYVWPRLHGNGLNEEGYTPTLYDEAPKGTYNLDHPEEDDDNDDDTDGPEDDA